MARVRGRVPPSLSSAGCGELPTAARDPMEREEQNDLDRARRPLEIHTNSADNGRVLERVRALPGVEAASLTASVPLSGDAGNWPIAIEGRPAPQRTSSGARDT